MGENLTVDARRKGLDGVVAHSPAAAEPVVLPVLPRRGSEAYAPQVIARTIGEFQDVEGSEGSGERRGFAARALALSGALRLAREYLESVQSTSQADHDLVSLEANYNKLEREVLKNIREALEPKAELAALSTAQSLLLEKLTEFVPGTGSDPIDDRTMAALKELDIPHENPNLGEQLSVILHEREKLEVQIAGMQNSLKLTNESLQAFVKDLTRSNKKLTYIALYDETKIGKAEEGAQISVKGIRQLQTRVARIEQELVPLLQEAMKHDAALRIVAAEQFSRTGDVESATRLLARLYEGSFGKQLRAQEAAEALPSAPKSTILKLAREALSKLEFVGSFGPIERELSRGHNGAETAARAVQVRSEDVTHESDVREQLYATTPLRELWSRSGAAYYSKSGIPRYKGVPQTTLKDCTVRGLELRASGLKSESYVVHFSSEADKAWMNIPSGALPVLLEPPVAARQYRARDHRRGTSEFVVENSPLEFILKDSDVGYVLNGKVHSARGGEIELGGHPQRAWISKQLIGARGFSVSDYKSDTGVRRIVPGKPHGEPCDQLHNLTLASGQTIKGIKISAEVIQALTAPPPSGMTLVLNRVPKPIVLSTQYNAGGTTRGNPPSFYRFILGAPDELGLNDIAYAKIETAGTKRLVVQQLAAGGESRTSESDLRREEIKTTKSIQRILGENEDIAYVQSMAVSSARTLNNLQGFIEAAQQGSPRQAFVEFARVEGKTMLDTMNSAETQKRLQGAKKTLDELKKIKVGAGLGAEEKAIVQQIDSLENFITVVRSERTKHILTTVVDASKFSADTWANWSGNDLPVLAGSVAVATAAAVAVTVTVVGTGGTAAPLWITLAATSAATTAGGMVGGELSKEALFAWNQNRRDGLNYDSRSLLGSKLSGARLFDEQKGSYRNIGWAEVGGTYGRQFAVGFATNLAVIGGSQFAASRLSTLIQRPGLLEKVVSNSPMARSVMRKLAETGNSNALSEAEKAGLKRALTKALDEFGKEYIGELKDEAAEAALTKVFDHLYKGIVGGTSAQGTADWGNAAALAIGTLKGIRIGKGSFRYDASQFGAGAEGKSNQDRFAQQLREQGYFVTELSHGFYSLRHAESGALIQLVPEETGLDRLSQLSLPKVDSATWPTGYLPHASRLTDPAGDLTQAGAMPETASVTDSYTDLALPQALVNRALEIVPNTFELSADAKQRLKDVGFYEAFGDDHALFTLDPTGAALLRSECETIFSRCTSDSDLLKATLGSLGFTGELRHLQKVQRQYQIESQRPQSLAARIWESAFKRENPPDASPVSEAIKYFRNLNRFVDEIEARGDVIPDSITDLTTDRYFGELAERIFDRVSNDSKGSNVPGAPSVLLWLATRADKERFDSRWVTVSSVSNSTKKWIMENGAHSLAQAFESPMYAEVLEVLRSGTVEFSGEVLKIEGIRQFNDRSANQSPKNQNEALGKNIAVVLEASNLQGNKRDLILKYEESDNLAFDRIATQLSAAAGLHSYRVDSMSHSPQGKVSPWIVIEKLPASYLGYTNAFYGYLTRDGTAAVENFDPETKKQFLEDIGGIIAVEYILAAQDCKAKHILLDTETSRPFRIDWEYLLRFNGEPDSNIPFVMRGDERNLVREIVGTRNAEQGFEDIRRGLRKTLEWVRSDLEGGAQSKIVAMLRQNLQETDLEGAVQGVVSRLNETNEEIERELDFDGLAPSE